MTEQEGNKLIAKFMGDYDLFHWGRDPFNEMIKAKYHKDWNTLIPVVQKIKSLEKEFPVLTHHVVILFIWENITVVWEHVVEFIEQYNQIKTNDNIID